MLQPNKPESLKIKNVKLPTKDQLMLEFSIARANRSIRRTKLMMYMLEED